MLIDDEIILKIKKMTIPRLVQITCDFSWLNCANLSVLDWTTLVKVCSNPKIYKKRNIEEDFNQFAVS